MTLRVSDTMEGYEDVLGSGGIYRKCLRKSNGEAANYGDEVRIRYSEWKKDDNQLITDGEERTFRIGDSEIYPAIELVSKLMQIGQVDEVFCDPRFAYGENGWKERNVPPNTSIRVVIELLWISRKAVSDMTSSELLEEATKKKDSGNRYHKSGDYEAACKQYKRALKILELWEHSAHEADRCQQLLLAIGNNLGNVQHKLQRYKDARKSCREVLEIDPQNLKALHRMAKIALQESEFNEATTFTKKALAIDPNNRLFRDLLVQIAEKKKDRKVKETKLYAKLGKSNSKPIPSPKKQTNHSRNIWSISAILACVIAGAVMMYLQCV